MSDQSHQEDSDFEVTAERSTAASPRPCELLVIGGRTEAALADRAQALASWLEGHPSAQLGDVAYTLVTDREAFQHCALITAGGRADAVEHLRAVAARPGNAVKAVERAVFLFSGQGTQEPQMAAELFHGCDVYRSAFEDCARIARDVAGLDLGSLVYGELATADRLRETRFAQPALFAVEYALANCWLHWGLQPAAVIGHSFGEYAAACIAGVMSLEDALELVIARARLLSGMPAGAMLSVRLDEESLGGILPSDLDIAAVNSPSHCVVSGTGDAVRDFADSLTARDIPCTPLHMSQAFHSRMMTAALEPFSELVSGVRLQPPEIPFIPTARFHGANAVTPESPAYWVNQITATVRFAEAVREAARCAPTLFIEVGPRRVLSQLAPLCVSEFSRMHRCVPSLEGGGEDVSDWTSILRGAGTAWISGLPFDWDRFFAGEGRRRLPLPAQAQAGDSARAAVQGANADRPKARSANRTSQWVEQIRHSLREHVGLEVSPADEATEFFELGLDSLALTQLAAQLSRESGVTVSFRQLTRSERSVNALAAYLDGLVARDRIDGAAPAASPEDTPEHEPTVACEHPGYDAHTPPVPGARLGRNPDGNPAWFIEDEERPGEYRQLLPA